MSGFLWMDLTAKKNPPRCFCLDGVININIPTCLLLPPLPPLPSPAQSCSHIRRICNHTSLADFGRVAFQSCNYNVNAASTTSEIPYMVLLQIRYQQKYAFKPPFLPAPQKKHFGYIYIRPIPIHVKQYNL